MDFAWITFDFIESARSWTTTASLWWNLDSCSSWRTLWSAVIISPNQIFRHLSTRSSIFLPHGALVTFLRLHTLQCGLWEHDWKHTAFLLHHLKLVLVEDAREEELPEVVLPRQLERRLSNLKISSPRQSFPEWLKSFWQFCSYNSLVVAHSSCLLPVIQCFGLVVGCLHSWDSQKNVVLDFRFDCSPILHEIWWLAWTIHTNKSFLHTFSKRMFRGSCFQNNWTWTNMSKLWTYTGCFVWVGALGFRKGPIWWNMRSYPVKQFHQIRPRDFDR